MNSMNLKKSIFQSRVFYILALAVVLFPFGGYAASVNTGETYQPWSLINPVPATRSLVNPASPFLGSEGQAPAFMLFSSHADLSDVSWIDSELTRIVQSHRDKTIVLWIEHAHPSGLPVNIHELQAQYGNLLPEGTNWYRELGRKNLRDVSRNTLRRIYEGLYEKIENVSALFDHTMDPYSLALRDSIRRLESKGFPILLRFERSPFESYLEDLRREVKGIVVHQMLANGHKREAFRELARAYRHLNRALRLRDESLFAAIRLETHKQGEIHVLIRGLAHMPSMTQIFHDAGMRFEYKVNEQNRSSLATPISRFLTQFHNLPSLASKPGRRYLQDEITRIASLLNLG